MGTPPEMLEVREIDKRYGDVTALAGVSLDVPAGEIVGFVGPNGAGKTTAMRIVLGVLAADSGTVRWRGQTIDEEVRRRIGYMPEERGLYPKMQVRRQLEYFAQLHALGPAEAAESADRWIDRLGLTERSDSAVEELSLGNQQRVQLAAALVHDPELLVLDEPFSGLDPVGVEVLAGVLVGEARERELPVIFSSHQLELVERLCDSVAIIKSGRIIASGDVETLRDERSRDEWEIEVEDAAEDWLEGFSGARRTNGTVVRLDPGTDPNALLDRARAAGTVVRFGRRRATLEELFRAAIAEPREDREP